MAARLQEQYETTIKPALIKQFGYANTMQAPRLEKIVVNMGVGEVVNDSKTPSGRVHVGAVRGVIIHDVVYRALKSRR